MSSDQVAPELAPIKTKLEGIIGELKQLQSSGTPTQAQVFTPNLGVLEFERLICYTITA